MSLKKTVKKIIHYDEIRLVKKQGEKLGIGFPESLVKIRVVPFNYNRILSSANNDNISSTCFYYGLDDKLAVFSDKRLLGNMPVDYSYILNNGLNGIKDKNLRKVISDYIDRANDVRIKKKPVNNLKDALQMILFWNQILWQSGHRLNGLGRLDKVLANYNVTEDAEDLILNFLKTLHYCYGFKSNVLKGDIGQIILVGGAEEDGSYFRNAYTDLFIECSAELKLPDPKVLLRASSNMPKDLLNKAVESIATGIGSPLISNDDIIIPLLENFGYEKTDAYNYGVSACWEPLSIGNSLEQNNLCDIEFGTCANEMITDIRFLKCKSFEDVLELYYEKLNNNLKSVKERLDSIKWVEDELLTCLMNLNKDIALGGAKYNNYGILSTGMSNAINSLLNIKKFVFDNNQYTLKEIQEIIINNYPKDIENFCENSGGFGTDSLIAVDLTNKIINVSENILKDYRNYLGGKVKFGLSSPNYMNVGKNAGATLDGRKEKQPFPTHISREKGEPITEIMNFESKLKFTGTSCNANVIDVMVQASLIKDNVDKFTDYIMGGIKEGIFQLQMNVLSYAQLVDAKAHPEKYPNLIVRVWGFSAYFNDLPEEYKDNLIRRAKEMEKIA